MMSDSALYSEARNKAIAHIGIAVSTSGKIRTYLSDLGYDRNTVSDVIDQLREEKYIDDARYARKILRARSGAKAEGRTKLAMRMESEGIPGDVIDDVLDNEAPSDEETIGEVIDSRFPLSSFSTDPDQARRDLAKAIRYLESRGYSSSLALSAFRKRLDDVQ